MKSLSNIFKKTFKSNRSSQKKYEKKSDYSSPSEVFDFIELINSWPQIIGERIANVTTPLKQVNKKLIVLTAHSAFSQQLSLMEQQILEKIYERFPSLKKRLESIGFQTNDQFFKEKKASRKDKVISIKDYNHQNQLNPYSPNYKKIKKEAEDFFSDIHCEETRETLTNILVQIRNSQ